MHIIILFIATLLICGFIFDNFKSFLKSLIAALILGGAGYAITSYTDDEVGMLGAIIGGIIGGLVSIDNEKARKKLAATIGYILAFIAFCFGGYWLGGLASDGWSIYGAIMGALLFVASIVFSKNN